MNRETIDRLFHEIYDETYEKCLIYVTCKCRETADVSDIVQETYLAFYKMLNRRGAKHIMNAEAYIIKIAKSQIYRYYLRLDKIKHLTSFLHLSKDEQDSYEPEMQEEIDGGEPDTWILNRETLEEIWDYLKEKPTLVQKAFCLFYYADMPISEIASKLGLSQSAVKNYVYRTTKEIRKVVRREG